MPPNDFEVLKTISSYMSMMNKTELVPLLIIGEKISLSLIPQDCYGLNNHIEDVVRYRDVPFFNASFTNLDKKRFEHGDLYHSCFELLLRRTMLLLKKIYH